MVFMVSYTPLAAFLLLFIAVGVGFIFVHLVAGKFLRPNKPDAEKKTIYECGEPTIGSAWIQFDLRFYVVALLFVIFDVEVAFFFPWAEVFGKANAIVAAEKPTTDAESLEVAQKIKSVVPQPPAFPENQAKIDALNDPAQVKANFEATQSSARSLAWFSLLDILVFFGVLLVGFAYLWKRGDLAWVRSTLAEEKTIPPPTVETPAETRELVGTPH
jgi:NADH-quinone oxidoreductase subunit A